MGYVVPADAPSPSKDQAGFEDVALDMKTIETYANQTRSKHALFVFDCCFSGSVFYVTRAGVPPVISYKASKPVRQLITSGSETESVPDVSIFREQFVAALNGEGSDLNGDGYLTGEELGVFLEEKVINYSGDTQHPQYGKIRDPKLDKGDVVFTLPQAAATPPTNAPTPPPTDFSLDDVMPEAWQDYADKMAAAKAAAWQKFVTVFAADNVYDTQDEDMRRFARERISYWQPPTPRPSQEGKSTPPPAPPQQGGEQTSPRLNQEGTGVGSCWENETPGAMCKEDTTGMEFVYAPGGCFQMGSPTSESGRYDDEGPAHEVCLKRFWMGKFEVTQAQWETVMGNNPSWFKGANRPVEQVSWNDAQAFLKKLNASIEAHSRASLQFRLPSEAEWEYAARAGTQTAYSFGDDPARLGEYAWYGYENNAGKQTHPVGQKKPNAFGLYDMHGNVWEWVADTYHDNYTGAPTDGSVWGNLDDTKAKVLRGGSWYGNRSRCRSASRNGDDPAYRNDGYIGCRVVAVPLRTQ